MNKRNIAKLLIFLMTTQFGVAKAFGQAEAEQQIKSVIQHSATILKQPNVKEQTTMNPKTGQHDGLNVSFDLQTNGNDASYDFILKSSIETDGGQVSAYSQVGADNCILFGNTRVFPTESAISNAKLGGKDNQNVIAYPVQVSIGSPMTVDYMSNYGVHGDCFVVKVNDCLEKRTLVHSILGVPFGQTYSIGQDQYGSYKAVVTFTAVAK